MKYYIIPPSRHLATFIRYYWVLESDEPYTHCSMPDVCPELLFHYSGCFDECLADGTTTPSFTAGLHGQTIAPRKFHINSGFGIFGVYLYPQSIPLLFNLPAADLTNQLPSLQQLLRHEAAGLEEAMACAANNTIRMSIIENFVTHKLAANYKEELPVFHSIQTIIKNKGLVKIKQLAGDHFISERQFERQFQRFAGFSPKLFARIVRFQGALALYGSRQRSLTDIALESGYYDQSHFIHEFKTFAGYQPKEYFSGRSGATAWRDEQLP